MSLSVIAATSPPPSAEVVLPAPTMFRAGNYIDNSCLRCRKTVYPTDKIGPLKDYTFFHSGCFRCIECNSKLTLKTYFNNQVQSITTEFPIPSFIEVFQISFWEFPWLVGCSCS